MVVGLHWSKSCCETAKGTFAIKEAFPREILCEEKKEPLVKGLNCLDFYNSDLTTQLLKANMSPVNYME